MDLLEGIGTEDQLTSARAENAVLTKKVKELSDQVKLLTVENQSLLAELEVYRKESALPNFSNLALGSVPSTEVMEVDETPDEFVKLGNGVFPTESAVTLPKLHQNANPICCVLNPDDTLLATGGADCHLCLCQWGAALAPTPDAVSKAVERVVRLQCPGPVICAAFSQQNFGRALPVLAAGCMDGSVILIGYGTGLDGLSASVLKPSIELKCIKYVKGLAWSPSAPILAIASADGIVVVAQVSNLQDSGHVKVEVLDKLHLSGTIESICFSGDGTNLICYTRETPYLSYFNLEKGFEQTKINLNKGGGGGAAAGGFEEHVSFAVMDIAVSPNGKFLALATDTSRNIVIDAVTGKHIRNLYGHTNDGFSNPKIAWSCNGQYVLGNTQEDGSVCVWDVASASIVKRLVGHTNPIRGLFSSRLSDTLVTTSFDKQTKIWLTPME